MFLHRIVIVVDESAKVTYGATEIDVYIMLFDFLLTAFDD